MKFGAKETATKKLHPNLRQKEEVEDEEELDESEDLKPKTMKSQSFIKEKQDDDDDEGRRSGCGR